MELANIEKLVEKYLNAETTLKEEQTLRNYFATGTAAPHLQEFGMLFGYFKENQSEAYTKTIKLNTKKQKKNFKWMSVVASVALLASVFFGYEAYQKRQQEKQFAQIKEALQMVSFNLNKGNDALYAVSDNLTKGNEAVDQLKTFPNAIGIANEVIFKVNN